MATVWARGTRWSSTSGPRAGKNCPAPGPETSPVIPAPLPAREVWVSGAASLEECVRNQLMSFTSGSEKKKKRENDAKEKKKEKRRENP